MYVCQKYYIMNIHIYVDWKLILSYATQETVLSASFYFVFWFGFIGNSIVEREMATRTATNYYRSKCGTWPEWAALLDRPYKTGKVRRTVLPHPRKWGAVWPTWKSADIRDRTLAKCCLLNQNFHQQLDITQWLEVRWLYVSMIFQSNYVGEGLDWNIFRGFVLNPFFFL